ncbi:GntR family transcriptional regulator [Methylobacterium terricola]|nr:GntR family transcriptional regulator [Methylobacterium terricola]
MRRRIALRRRAAPTFRPFSAGSGRQTGLAASPIALVRAYTASSVHWSQPLLPGIDAIASPRGRSREKGMTIDRRPARDEADRRAPLVTSSAVSLQDRIYAHLKAGIAEGRIRPGTRLLESQLARTFGVSRSPARGALNALAAERLVSEDGARGYRVGGIAAAGEADDAAPPLDPAPMPHQRRWEILYGAVEQELYGQILFHSVRVNDLRLAQHYGVSRTVTRDLLARMDGVGLVTKDAAGRWVARRVTPQRIRNLYALRRLLEPVLLAEAAPRVPTARLRQARTHVEATLARPAIDGGDFDRAETDLHRDLLGLSGNDELIHALKPTHFLFGPTRHLIDPILGIPMHKIEHALHEHLAILDHLLDGDARGAALLLERHLAEAIDRWLGRFEVAATLGSVACPDYLTPSE